MLTQDKEMTKNEVITELELQEEEMELMEELQDVDEEEEFEEEEDERHKRFTVEEARSLGWNVIS